MPTSSAPERVLAGLTASQLEAVTSRAAPLCVIAGAGSGKTRVLTRRVARRVLEGSADPDRTLVLTFTRKAAEELRKRLAHLGVAPAVNAGTFHAMAYAQLRRRWADEGRRPPAVLDSPNRLVGRLLADRSGSKPEQATVAAISGEISWARARVLSPEQYPAEALRSGRSGTDPNVVADVYARYTESKKLRAVVDLDDLIESCADLLEHDDAFRSTQHWSYRHFFVDELQDLNPAQWRLLRGWLGDRDDLFVVGDPLQAVYSWNGADSQLLTRMTELLPGTTVLRLDDNHRCTSPVVELARAALGNLAGSEQIRSARDDQETLVAINDFPDDVSEAMGVAHWLRERHRPGRAWSSLAVVARTNARLDPVADALGRAGIPFQRRGLTARDQENAAIAALRAMPRNMPLRTALAELASAMDDLDWLGDEVDSICAEYPDADVGHLLSWRAAVTGPEGFGSAREHGDGVQLTTFHRAKGLEWTAVAVVGIEAGTVPISYAVRTSALEEERRLLYVALTRAEQEVWCSWARRRTVGTQSWSCEPSPYLAAINEAARRVERTDPVPAAKRISELRSKLATVC
ncbi:MAG: ATP-dependent helicase [Acidimicrobiales bacterium]